MEIFRFATFILIFTRKSSLQKC